MTAVDDTVAPYYKAKGGIAPLLSLRLPPEAHSAQRSGFHHQGPQQRSEATVSMVLFERRVLGSRALRHRVGSDSTCAAFGSPTSPGTVGSRPPPHCARADMSGRHETGARRQVPAAMGL